MSLVNEHISHSISLANEGTKRKQKKSKKCEDEANKISFPDCKVSVSKSFLEYFGHKKNIDADKLYETSISKEMMDKYGPYFSDTFDKKNVEIPPQGFMLRHKFNPILRTLLFFYKVINSTDIL